MSDIDDNTTTLGPVANRSARSRWVPWCAWLTVAAVCPLVFLGALVTTMKAGMVDERAFVSPHQSIPELWQGGRGLGFNIEHSHRLAGEFAGLCGILFAGVCWFTETKGSRWLGLIALALISLQGLLGYFRVALNSWWGPNLAWLHGCFAQVVFAILVGLAVLTSRSKGAASARQASADRVHGWALVCIALVLGQLILGGVIRHEPSLIVARVHLVGAFIVAIALVRVARLALRERNVYRGWPYLLMGLLALQVLLGVETGINWMARYFDPAFASAEPFGLMLMRTSHYFVGSLLFAVTTVLALRPLPETAWRPVLGGAPELQSLQGGAV